MSETGRLRRRAQELQRERDSVLDQLHALELAEAKQRYNCPCVRLNKDIGIFDMSEQWSRWREGLGCGLVAETLSADSRCACGGTGRRSVTSPDKTGGDRE